MITLSVYGMSKQDNKKPNQMVIVIMLDQSVSLLMEIHQLLVVMISLSVSGMFRMKKKFYQLTKIIKISKLNLLFQNIPLPVSNNFTILRISQTPTFQAQGALILKGEFINHQGIDLKTLFKQKRSCLLDDFQQK